MNFRLEKHPILREPKGDKMEFFFNGIPLYGRAKEAISSALFANGIHAFGRHPKDGAPQGIFCANGQCGQCLVLVDGVPMKACITPVEEGLKVRSLDDLPDLYPDDTGISVSEVGTTDTEVLIIGGGPAGLSAGSELGSMGVRTIIVDDKQELGGKLALQSHNFFGSIRDCFAGTRGFEIGERLSRSMEMFESVEIWLNSPVVGVFSDGKFGISNDGVYRLVQAKRVIIATGAREKVLAFNGCDLPGIYGAGAFQTLVNRDLVKAAKKLFIIGGGNVGLIAAYQALQAGIEVQGIAEALPRCGGYKVHLDKLLRLGVPIYTSHTVLKAEGNDHIGSILISEIDPSFAPIRGTEKEFHVDTLLVAVGLSPVDEITGKAMEFGIPIYSAGDADAIAEASAAMFSGRIVARKVLKDFGYDVILPEEWGRMLDILRNKPGPVHPLVIERPERGIYPIIRCLEEIPCNPCTDVCPLRSIDIPSGNITDLPEFRGKCVGCGRCVSICPGLAITLVDRRYDPTGGKALVVVPWEMPEGTITTGICIVSAGLEGEIVGEGKVVGIKGSEWQNRRALVALEVPSEDADHVAGIRLVGGSAELPPGELSPETGSDGEIIICRCERITKDEIRELIREGARDINDLKSFSRVGMGPCGGKTCMGLIKQVFRAEGIPLSEIVDHVERPLTQEVALNVFLKGGDE